MSGALRRGSGGLVAGLVLVAAAPAGAWVHNAVRWPQERMPLSIELYDTGVDQVPVEALESIVRASLDEWNSVPCAWISLAFGGRTDHRIERDDRQTLEWIEDPAAWVYGADSAGATISDVFDDPRTPEHEGPRVDIAFNGVDFEWVEGGGGGMDFEHLDPGAVLTHEMGHLLGLDHSRDDNAATMGFSYLPDLGQTTLGLDDKIGLCEKYWEVGSECAKDADCRDRSTCVEYTSEANGGAVVRLCEERHGSFGDLCWASYLNCQGYCLFTREDLSQGFCSDTCTTHADCPADWHCGALPTPDLEMLFCQRGAPGADAGPDGGPDGGAPVADAGPLPPVDGATADAVPGDAAPAGDAPRPVDAMITGDAATSPGAETGTQPDVGRPAADTGGPAASGGSSGGCSVTLSPASASSRKTVK